MTQPNDPPSLWGICTSPVVRLSPSAIANDAAETLKARGTSGKNKALVVSTSGDTVMDVTTVGT